MSELERIVGDLQDTQELLGGLPFPVIASNRHGVLRAKLIYTKNREVVFACLSSKAGGSPYNGIFIPVLEEERLSMGYEGLNIKFFYPRMSFVIRGDGIEFTFSNTQFLRLMEGAFQVNNKKELM